MARRAMPISSRTISLCTAMLLAAITPPARADPVEADARIDLPIALAATALALAATRIPVDTSRRWERETFGALDASVRERFSARAAALSDLLVATAIAAPVFTEAGGIVDDGVSTRYLVYGQSLAISLALNATTKYLVQRPRPYAYHRDPRVAAYAARQGKDSHLSFYSGHAALAFTAATTGGYLFATRTERVGPRAAMWASGTTVAAATAILRVRAGKHFYSDVVIGAVLGVAVGYAVPRLHHDGIELAPAEVGAIAGGLALGTAAALLLPMPDDLAMSLAPIFVENGAGVALAGAL